MTAPRQILPGVTYLITRRCVDRSFLLRPSRLVNAIFEYVLAVAAARHGILLHAYCVMSNHFHLVLTDPFANLPAFERDLGALVARAVNASLGRRGYFWEEGSYSAVALEDDAAVLEKLVYALANPVAAGLVRCAEDWPGLWSDPGRLGGPATVVERPTGFFREHGAMPAVASLQLHAPAALGAVTGLVATVRELLRQAEDRAAAVLAAAGRAFLGVARALAQRPTARPSTVEPRRTLRPTFATKDPRRQLEAVRRLKAFLQAHKAALIAWRQGLRDVDFPAGTYLMRVLHAARCTAAG